MNHSAENKLLVTGATGLVGSQVIQRAREHGQPVVALVRSADQATFLQEQGVELVEGDLTRPETLQGKLSGVTRVVHTAAKVGDWGNVEEYRQTNVTGLASLISAIEEQCTLQRLIHISSLGVYEARDHYGTDETEPPHASGIDGYTLSKIEAEQLLQQQTLPYTILRPGFIYGPRDRTVLPRILERLKSGQFAYLGSPEKLMNNTWVKHLVDAIFLALNQDQAIGQTYNITDVTLVSKREFISTIAELAGYPSPEKVVPLPVARHLAKMLEGLWRLLGKKQAPILSQARIKFLGLNLDFSTLKAQQELGYHPQTTYREAMSGTIDWFRENQKLP
ncbi:3 beta-hydroxysteroid dehydrogenase/Delta 5--_4-isomerase [Gimesia panareensis]|uniref:3 beta-hydroxysteroid dehydrogenase/Delta 5-->4-isomerase n=1 Tax=Gimesia panareensis TaxID=2527978 RepID=A0A518FK05_9PLAN|nr:NAD-dependent epimerase/dehydratase family protein [Gimesia panareensis]QDV16688.1 3 beta-hydroxysteroid dehydrogenase/Delta 5-->4-isomerase [Gimesia panareensis]